MVLDSVTSWLAKHPGILRVATYRPNIEPTSRVLRRAIVESHMERCCSAGMARAQYRDVVWEGVGGGLRCVGEHAAPSMLATHSTLNQQWLLSRGARRRKRQGNRESHTVLCRHPGLGFGTWPRRRAYDPLPFLGGGDHNFIQGFFTTPPAELISHPVRYAERCRCVHEPCRDDKWRDAELKAAMCLGMVERHRCDQNAQREAHGKVLGLGYRVKLKVQLNAEDSHRT